MAGMQNTALSKNENTLVHRRPIVFAVYVIVCVRCMWWSPEMEKIICISMRINQKIKKV